MSEEADNHSLLYQKLGPFLEGWLSIGLIVQLIAVLLLTYGYETWMYLSFYIPLLIILVLNLNRLPHVFLQDRWFFTTILLFFFYFGISNCWAESNNDLLKSLKASLLSFLYIVGVALVARRERLGLVLKIAVVLSGLIGAAFIAKNYVINADPLMARLGHSGFSGLESLGNASRFGAYFGAMFVIGVFLCRDMKSGIAMSILLFFTLINLGVGFFTYSRTMWVGFLLVALVYTVLSERRKFLLYAFVCFVVSSLLLFLFFPEIIERFILRSGFSWRPQIWLATIGKIMDKPIIGYGAGSDFALIVTRAFNGDLQSATIYHPHNIYLSMFYFSGIVGGFLYLAILWMGLARMMKNVSARFFWVAFGLMLFSMAEQFFEVYGIVRRPSEYYLISWLPLGILIGRTYAIENEVVSRIK